MSYIVLARKYRPQSFGEVYAQEHVTEILHNAIQSKRIAHAYLFTGPRGVGKTSMARIMAKSLNCEKGPTVSPCNECNNCLEITSGTSTDVIEIDGASNTGVDDIRELQKELLYAPSKSRYKIYIIDEVHMLSKSAFNALLKTLEEPPENVVSSLPPPNPRRFWRPSYPAASATILRGFPSTPSLKDCGKSPPRNKSRLTANPCI